MGMKVRAMMSSPKMLGLRTSSTARRTVASLPGRRPVLAQVPLDVLDLDDGRVDDHPDGDGQAAERHEVRREAGQAHHDEGEERGQREGEDDDEGAPEAAEEEVQDEDDEEGADEEGLGDGVDALGDDVRPPVEGLDLQALREDAARVDLGDPGLDGLDDLAAVGAAQHHDDAADDLLRSRP